MKNAIILVALVSSAAASVLQDSYAAVNAEALHLIQSQAKKHSQKKIRRTSFTNRSHAQTKTSAKKQDDAMLESSRRHRLPIDIIPDKARLTKSREEKSTIVSRLFAPARKYGHFRFIDFMRRLVNDSESDSSSDASNANSTGRGENLSKKDNGKKNFGSPIGLSWPLAMFAVFSILFLLTKEFCSRLDVSAPCYDERVSVGRGRPCWTYLCAFLVFFLIAAVFCTTVVSIQMVNKEIVKHPEVIEESPGGPVTVTRYPIKEPAKEGFEAGTGVYLSVIMGCILTFAWRWRGTVQISASLLAQFALRGSTLALVMAILFEILGEEMLSDAGLDQEEGVSIGSACMMLIVGASEEGSKLFAVLCGTWIKGAALANSGQSNSCITKHVLVESPRALMLAGFAVGFGFMINENAEYIIAVVGTPPMDYSSEGDDELVGATALLVTSVLTICVRVLLNIHPWWAAISAARIGRLAFQEGRDTAWPSAFEFFLAIFPSALAHACYDFLVGSNAPAIIAMGIPPFFWYTARWAFMSEWNSFEELQARPVSVEGKAIKAPEGKAVRSNASSKLRRGAAAPSQKKV